MHSRSALGRMLVLALLLALVPAAAWAGKKVVKGEQSLKITEKLTPAKAGAKNTTIHFTSVYLDPKHPGQQPPYNSKSIVSIPPKGTIINAAAVAQCKQSAATATGSGGAPAVCPAGSKVGTGSVVVNARPAVPNLITGTVTAFNAVDDKGGDGYWAGSPELLLYIQTSLPGVNVTDPFHIVNGPGGRLELIVNLSKPSKPGVQPGNVTLQRLDLTLHGNGSKPYVSNPKTCTGAWLSKLIINNWFGQPSVTATDKQKCK